MAGEEKNEAASPKRRQEAREKGNLPRSADLTSAAVLIVSGYVLTSTWDQSVSAMKEVMVRFFSEAPTAVVDGLWTRRALFYSGTVVGKALLPLWAAILVTVTVVGVAQSGLPSSLKPLVPDFKRLNPLTGLQRMVSAKGVVELVKAMLKVCLLGWMAYSFGRGLLTHPAAGYQPDTADLANLMFVQSWTLAKKLIFTMLLLGAADYGYQRWSYEKSIRMTTQELKEEMKETEGNPQIKSRIRQRMRQMSQQRMMQQVPKAQVVVVNPTHYAVALRYEVPMGAPRVVAKGMDLMAQRIRDVAKASHVPIVSNPPLARALYKACDLDEDIPGDFYQAVAEILAYIYRLRHGVSARSR